MQQMCSDFLESYNGIERKISSIMIAFNDQFCLDLDDRGLARLQEQDIQTLAQRRWKKMRKDELLGEAIDVLKWLNDVCSMMWKVEEKIGKIDQNELLAQLDQMEKSKMDNTRYLNDMETF